MSADPSIFKAYDIRGVYPEQLDEEGAAMIARSYAILLQVENPGKRLKIAVGMDMRLSSPGLRERVTTALLERGLDVDEIGLVSTPTFYYAVAKYGYDGGVQVTASHNPKQYNGLKLVRRNAVPVSGPSGIYAIRDALAADAALSSTAKPGTRGVREGVAEAEAEDQAGSTGSTKKFRIVIDAANGMGALDMDVLFGRVPADLIRMNFELDGTFPAHEADPLKAENNKEVCARIVVEGADLGISIDGDGDRYFIIDEKGETLPPHILRGILAQIELKEHPGALVAYDIRPGRITRDMIDELGGRAIVTPVGHSLIKEMMIKEDAVFGGESSGHYFYKLSYGTFEAPMVYVTKFLHWLSAQGKSLSEAVAPYKRYAHSGEINFHLPDRATIDKKIEEIKTKYADGKQLHLDGVSIEYADHWFNVRASNTEPLLRLTVEALDPGVLGKKVGELKNLIAQASP